MDTQQKTTKVNNENSIFKNIFSPKALWGLLAYIIIAVVLFITTFNFTKIPQIKFVEPEQPTVIDAAIPQQTLVVDKQEGAFQVGIEEGQYEESMVTVVYEPAETCFIGGIRMDAMKNSALTDVKFITTDNDSIDWLQQTAEKELQNMQQNVKLCIVSVGINNLNNSREYLDILNDWSTQFSKISFVFISLGPVDETLYKGCTNTEIRNFNNEIKDKLNDNWRFVDLYQYLVENGIESIDGITYSNSLNSTLLTWILSESEKEQVLQYVPVQPEE